MIEQLDNHIIYLNNIPKTSKKSVDGILEHCFTEIKNINLLPLNITYCRHYFSEQLQNLIQWIVDLDVYTIFLNKNKKKHTLSELDLCITLQFPSRFIGSYQGNKSVTEDSKSVIRPELDVNALQSDAFVINGIINFNANLNVCKPYNACDISELSKFLEIKKQKAVNFNEL